MTRRYTEYAVDYIKKNKNRPFFLYLAHTFPHTPLHTNERFEGRSNRGLYGDVVEELDWSVGEVLKALKEMVWMKTHWSFLPVTTDHGWYSA